MSDRLKGSITVDSNPEGINQYSGGSGKENTATKSFNQARRRMEAGNASRVAVEATKLAERSRDKGTKTQSANHEKAAKAHELAAQRHKEAGQPEHVQSHMMQASYHRSMIKQSK